MEPINRTMEGTDADSSSDGDNLAKRLVAHDGPAVETHLPAEVGVQVRPADSCGRHPNDRVGVRDDHRIGDIFERQTLDSLKGDGFQRSNSSVIRLLPWLSASDRSAT